MNHAVEPLASCPRHSDVADRCSPATQVHSGVSLTWPSLRLPHHPLDPSNFSRKSAPKARPERATNAGSSFMRRRCVFICDQCMRQTTTLSTTTTTCVNLSVCSVCSLSLFLLRLLPTSPSVSALALVSVSFRRRTTTTTTTRQSHHHPIMSVRNGSVDYLDMQVSNRRIQSSKSLQLFLLGVT
jgi:hypothetical protein